mgnify:CR=1 FL=1
MLPAAAHPLTDLARPFTLTPTYPHLTFQQPCHTSSTPRSDMGCHIDGFIATQATTIVVGDAAISGKAADVIAAARTAFDAAVRLIRPGKHIADVSAPLQKVRPGRPGSRARGIGAGQPWHVGLGGNVSISRWRCGRSTFAVTPPPRGASRASLVLYPLISFVFYLSARCACLLSSRVSRWLSRLAATWWRA